jgi:PAS domain S-box-containing protein
MRPERRAPGHGRRATDEALARTDAALELYRELFEFAPEPYLVTDAPGIIEEANQAALAFFGRPKAFLRSMPLPFFVAVPDRRDFFARLARLSTLESGAEAWEARLAVRDGQMAQVAFSVAVAAVADGRPSRLRWLLHDVTPQRRAEAALRAQKTLAETLIEATRALVVLLDPEGHICRVNAAVEDASGGGRDELLGRAWSSLVGAGAEGQRAQREALEAGLVDQALEGEWPLRARSGAVRAVVWATRPLPAGSPPPMVLAVGHDVTELHEAQRQAQHLERLAAIGQVAAALAHESRNALQRAHAALALLRWQLKGQGALLELVGRVQAAQDDLLRLYEDVRGFAAPVALEARPCRLDDVWRRAWAEVLERWPGRAAVLAEDAVGVDLGCEADPYRLAQVFRNLFDNALGAAPAEARVTVVCREEEVGGRPGICVAVRDNGTGLGGEQKRRLFEPFYTTKTRGTGLGLAIVRRVVESHGGRIAAGDAPGGGAEITFTLPRRRS